MSASAPKLSTALQTVARGAISDVNLKTQILHLYRHVQKSVPHLLKVYAVDEPVSQVRRNIKLEFLRHGTDPMEPRVAKMLLFKGKICKQSELEEAQAQWKTRTHILKYVYEVVYQPHLARSKVPVLQQYIGKSKDPILAEFGL